MIIDTHVILDLQLCLISYIHVQSIARSSHVSNATLQHDYYYIYGKRVQVYSIRLRQIVSAEELKRSLEYGTSVISRVIVIRREGMYLVFLERSTLLSF